MCRSLLTQMPEIHPARPRRPAPPPPRLLTPPPPPPPVVVPPDRVFVTSIFFLFLPLMVCSDVMLSFMRNSCEEWEGRGEKWIIY